LKKFAFLTDLHWGYQTVGGHKTSTHDPKAIKAVLSFLADFKPHTIILGGDVLDCGLISHHSKGKPGRKEGFRLLADAKECRANVILPLEGLATDLRFIEGNHEDWLNDMVEEDPALEGLVDIRSLLHLEKWTFIPQGKGTSLGKLHFIHGDQIVGGGANKAQKAVADYERSVRFGHFHTYQAFTKTSAMDLHPKTGVAVPGLCRNGLAYAKGAPSRVLQGFGWGYVEDGGNYTDYVSIIVKGSFVALGKRYGGSKHGA
jgi:hypothetical protein